MAFPVNSGTFVVLDPDGLKTVSVSVSTHVATPPAVPVNALIGKLIGDPTIPPFMVTPDLFVGFGNFGGSSGQSTVLNVARVINTLPLNTEYICIPRQEVIFPSFGVHTSATMRAWGFPDEERYHVFDDTFHWKSLPRQVMVHITQFYMDDSGNVAFPPEQLFMSLYEFPDGTQGMFQMPLPNIYEDGRVCMGDENQSLLKTIAKMRREATDLTSNHESAIDEILSNYGDGDGQFIGYTMKNCPFTLISRIAMRGFEQTTWNMDLYQEWMYRKHMIFRWDLNKNQIVPADNLNTYCHSFGNDSLFGTLEPIIRLRKEVESALGVLEDRMVLDIRKDTEITEETIDELRRSL